MKWITSSIKKEDREKLINLVAEAFISQPAGQFDFEGLVFDAAEKLKLDFDDDYDRKIINAVLKKLDYVIVGHDSGWQNVEWEGPNRTRVVFRINGHFAEWEKN